MPKKVTAPAKPEVESYEHAAADEAPRFEPIYSYSRAKLDEEDGHFDFKEGRPVPTPYEPAIALHNPHGRFPDEFHNFEF